MPGMSPPRTAPSVRLRRLGAQLRDLREERGLTQEDVARRTGKDRSTLYRLETAQQRPQRATLIQLLDLYQVDEPRRGELLMLLREATQRGWMQPYRSELPGVYSDYIGFEEEARAISNYESLYIPGLLQTEDYARAQLHGTLPHATAAEIGNRVTARLERQQLLAREDPPRLWAIIDEAAARRQVGSPQVMAAQIARLAEAAAQPHITIQLIPFDAGAHPGMDGSFVVLEFPDPADRAIVYTESAAGGLFLEEEDEIRRYTLMFGHLRAAALRPGATADALAAIAAQA
jgi:transcriptional regulator with XRE-family HTH domain